MESIQIEEELAKKYELEQDIIDNNKIVKLTRDNVAKVNAYISTDSDYKDSNNINKGPIFYKNKGKIKYVGSSSYWLNNLKQYIDTNTSNYKYEEIIKYLVIAIDNENSTHLNSDKIGRKSTIEKILDIDKNQLLDYLKNVDRKYELITIIQTPKYKNEKNHLSFATKFCHYTSMFLFEGTKYQDNFSIYDNVLRESLPKYIKRYLNMDITPKEYTNNYNKYINYIDDIREHAKKIYGDEISRNGFDHLVWYYHKGRN